MKCIRCGNDTILYKKICNICLTKWTDMRTEIFNTLISKYGEMTPLNHEQFKKETKRLESIWRKDANKFNQEILKLKI